MSTPPDHALLVLVRNHRADPGSFPLPEVAPLIQIACAMASDDLGDSDRDRVRRAMGLLHKPLIQGLHKVIGQQAKRPVVYPTLISTVRTTPSLSKEQRYRQAGEIRQGGSMTLQNEVSQRTQPAVSGLEDIKGLALADLKLLRPSAIAEDCWWPGLDVLLTPAAEPQPVAAQAAPAAPASRVVAMDDARQQQLRARARKVCEHAGIDPDAPQLPRHLYRVLEGALKSLHGYTPEQIAEVKKRPDNLPPDCTLGRGQHIPVEVVFYILTSIAPRGQPDPVRASA